MADVQTNYAIITNIGLSKHAAKIASGQNLVITEIAFGDGDRIPAGGEAALLNEVIRFPVGAKGASAPPLTEAWFECLVPENAGPFVAYEAGLFDQDGDLIAVTREGVPINKTGPDRPHSFKYRLYVVFASLDNIIVQVTPGALDSVPLDRRVNTGIGLTGGGDLSDDVTISAEFASPTEHLQGQRDDRPTHPLGVAAMIGAAIGGLPPDQVLGLSTEAETIEGTNNTKATHAAGVAAAIAANQKSHANRATRLFARLGL